MGYINMAQPLEFELELNGNSRHISVKRSDDGSFDVKLETVDIATLKHENNCWVQTHGGKLPQEFINQIGSHIQDAEL